MERSDALARRGRRGAAVVGGLAGGCAVAVLAGSAVGARSVPTVTVSPRPQCVTRGRGPVARFVDVAPPARVLRGFGVLRRAPRPGDRLPREVRLQLNSAFSRVDRRYVRLLARKRGGERTYLVAGAGVVLAPPRYGCVRHQTRAAYARERAAFLRQARRYARRTVLCVLSTEHAERSQVCDDADRIARGSTGTSSDKGHAPASVAGLVPDRVAQVIPVYLDRPSCVVPARHNLYAYTVDHTAPNAFPYRVIWKDRAGRVINDFRPPAGHRPDHHAGPPCQPTG